jgi:thiol-disulfide isomerase/thioredoxin
MKMRTFTIVALALSAAGLLISGCDWFEEQPTENLPPATEITHCPASEVDEGDDLLFKWVGTDVDGVVVGYEWSFSGAPWIETGDDSVIVEAVDEGNHSFLVRAVDDKGEVDPAPPQCDFTALAVGEMVDRVVMVEVFTTYTCANCPKAEEALNNLMDSMGRAGLSVVGYHDWRGGDPNTDLLGTDETVARIAWYTDDPTFPGRPGWWPTVVFDGLRVVEGAETVEGAQANYAVEIQMREEKRSPVRLTVAGDLGGPGGSVQAGIRATGRLPGGPLVARCVVIEDHVYQRGFYYDFVARRVLEERPVSIAAIGDSTAVEWTFPVDESWNLMRVDAVVFVQNDAGREILQSARLGGE